YHSAEFYTLGGNLAYSEFESPSTFPTVTGTTSIIDPSPEWYHVALVRNGNGANNISLYVNGVLDATGTANVPMSTEFLTIGGYRWANNLTRTFNGEIDEVRIWNIARTEQEIRENMHLTLGGVESGLAAYWQFNEEGVFREYIQNGLGTLQGNATFVASGVNVGGPGVFSTINVPAGISTQTFGDALFAADFKASTQADEFTVTFQDFSPNSDLGLEANHILLRPESWTLNKRDPSLCFQADFIFTLDPTTVTVDNPQAYKLYHRSVNSSGGWTLVATASALNDAFATFPDLTDIGQYVVSRDTTVGGLPSLTLSTSTPLFLNAENGQASAPVSYTINGDNLTSSVLVSLSPGSSFELSLDGNTFSESLDLPIANGNIQGEPLTIQIRLKAGLPDAFYSDTISHTSDGAPSVTLAVDGIAETIILDANPPSITGLIASPNEPSASQFYTLNGENLSESITIEAPPGFEISLDN
ncbi:MAG: LamG domain-containing protein, partial [Bacteroidota bacterium]